MQVRVDDLVQRDARQFVLDLMREEPAILVEGPRGSGKSTLLRSITNALDGEVLDLDDSATARLAAEDPAGAISDRRLVFIDEYQHVPAILPALKREVDRDSRPGRFLVAGSVSGRLLPTGTETLAGRIHRLHLAPLAAGELLRGQGRLLAHLLREHKPVRVGADLTRRDYFDLVAAGGYPAALKRPTDAGRRRWYSSYLSTVADRDIGDFVQLRHPGALSRLYRLIAEQTGSVVARSTLGERLGLSPATARAYLDLLERVHLIAELPGWTAGVSAKVARRPKLHVTDTGLAAAAIQLDGRRLAASAIGGSFLESFVINEISKQVAVTDEPLTLGHFRDRSGVEVDAIIERANGSVIAVEVKSATSVSRTDAAGLRFVRDRLDSRFIAGVILHTGPLTVEIDEGIWAMPVAGLWSL